MSDAPHLSPSEYHRWLMDAHPPTHAYGSGDVVAWQNRLRPEVRRCLGWQPETPCDLNVRELWTREHELGTITKLVFTAEPHADVVAWWCTPKSAKPPYPTFICLQGHSTGGHNSIAVERDDNAQPMQPEGDRDFGIGCMQRGVAALCVEQRSFGERRELANPMLEHEHNCHSFSMHSLMMGRCAIGERVYDVDRAIDYLYTRDDVDRSRLGVMGNSGGGTISLFAAATLDRITHAMPSCYFCTFRDSIMSIYHCMDNYVPGLLQVAEMPDVMGLFAPKPVVLVAGRHDAIFPIDAAERAFVQLQKIYDAAGATDKCQLVIGEEGHRFYADQAWDAMLPHL